MTAHRPCGNLSADTGLQTPTGYWVTVTCPCGACFDRWVTVADADEDLLRSRLPACPN